MKIPMFPCKYHQTGGFSMAMLVLGRVRSHGRSFIVRDCCLFFQISAHQHYQKCHVHNMTSTTLHLALGKNTVKIPVIIQHERTHHPDLYCTISCCKYFYSQMDCKTGSVRYPYLHFYAAKKHFFKTNPVLEKAWI